MDSSYSPKDWDWFVAGQTKDNAEYKLISRYDKDTYLKQHIPLSAFHVFF